MEEDIAELLKEYKQGLLRGKNKCVRNAVQKYIIEVGGGKQSALQTAVFLYVASQIWFFCWHCLSSSPFQVSLPHIQPRPALALFLLPCPGLLLASFGQLCLGRGDTFFFEATWISVEESSG